jgi:hypothetical protein
LSSGCSVKRHDQSEFYRLLDVVYICREYTQGGACCGGSFAQVIAAVGLNGISAIALVNESEPLPGLYLGSIGYEVVVGLRTSRETSSSNGGDVVDPVGSLERIRTITLLYEPEFLPVVVKRNWPFAVIGEEADCTRDEYA